MALLASNSVQNEIEASQIICSLSAKGSMLSLLEQTLYLVAHVQTDDLLV